MPLPPLLLPRRLRLPLPRLLPIPIQGTQASSTCTVCIACTDSLIPAVPTDPPSDPFAQWAGSETIYDEDEVTPGPNKRDTITPSDRDSLDNSTVPLFSLAARDNAARSIPICGEEFAVPKYASYSSNGKGNTYKPYYSYKYQDPSRCASYKFELVQGETKRDQRRYATEHIYELQLVNHFLEWMQHNDAAIVNQLSKPSKKKPINMCSAVIRPLLVPTRQWSNVRFGPGTGVMTTRGARPIDDLLSRLSGGTKHSAELVYLEEKLNGMKAKLFRGGQTVSPDGQTYPDKLAVVARAAVVYQYLNDEAVYGVFRSVSGRMRQFYERMDAASAKGNNALAKKIKWADGYRQWEREFLEANDAKWRAWKNGLLDEVLAELASTRSPALIQLRASIQEQRAQGTGDLSDELFRASNKLLP
ncbi:hypothetical protein C8A01DRAFT_35548 [Parachaetomium inaequale]|uniref:Uncharacterized protein n=1 Tax=Parachaetomium inaequale TaxID=2588326 RepID=A0AAN6PGF8_9PEZI|nr:hypothetical protein C8A01DRAFT_35548 [Parachaetomium inaequale]